jgi:hypothetical protein
MARPVLDRTSGPLTVEEDRDRPTDASRRLLAVAAKHRAAAQALREAEEQACAGISERDRRRRVRTTLHDWRS